MFIEPCFIHSLSLFGKENRFIRISMVRMRNSGFCCTFLLKYVFQLEQKMGVFRDSRYCWRALARQYPGYPLEPRVATQLPILCNSEKKAKSVGCKIEDMRSRLCFLYPGIPGCL